MQTHKSALGCRKKMHPHGLQKFQLEQLILRFYDSNFFLWPHAVLVRQPCDVITDTHQGTSVSVCMCVCVHVSQEKQRRETGEK